MKSGLSRTIELTFVKFYIIREILRIIFINKYFHISLPSLLTKQMKG